CYGRCASHSVLIALSVAIILNLQSGRVQTNKVTPQILQTFENANTQIDKILAKSQTQQIDLQR
ncbi:hypothetical protein, partial [Nostoc sp. ChiQUE01b]|uniref:hypothetical protein n=1 Tax=Nostoc sp. ChiQUE01b TaxID=3075376 RepID=UPI002AD351FF